MARAAKSKTRPTRPVKDLVVKSYHCTKEHKDLIEDDLERYRGASRKKQDRKVREDIVADAVTRIRNAFNIDNEDTVKAMPKQIRQWFNNQNRERWRKATNRLKTMTAQRLWGKRNNDEVTTAMINKGVDVTVKRERIGNYNSTVSDLFSELTEEEKAHWTKLANSYNKNGGTEEEKSELADKKLDEISEDFIDEVYTQMGVLSVIMVARVVEQDGKKTVVVDIQNKRSPDSKVPSWTDVYGTNAIAKLNVHEFHLYAHKAFNVPVLTIDGEKQKELPEFPTIARREDLERDGKGFPVPRRSDELKTVHEKEAYVRQFLKIHYQMASSFKKKTVNWVKLSDPDLRAQFVDDKYLPPEVVLQDPSRLNEVHLVTLIDHWRARYDRDVEAFRFRAYREGSNMHPAVYTIAPPGNDDTTSDSDFSSSDSDDPETRPKASRTKAGKGKGRAVPVGKRLKEKEDISDEELEDLEMDVNWDWGTGSVEGKGKGRAVESPPVRKKQRDSEDEVGDLGMDDSWDWDMHPGESDDEKGTDRDTLSLEQRAATSGPVLGKNLLSMRRAFILNLSPGESFQRLVKHHITTVNEKVSLPDVAPVEWATWSYSSVHMPEHVHLTAEYKGVLGWIEDNTHAASTSSPLRELFLLVTGMFLRDLNTTQFQSDDADGLSTYPSYICESIIPFGEAYSRINRAVKSVLETPAVNPPPNTTTTTCHDHALRETATMHPTRHNERVNGPLPRTSKPNAPSLAHSGPAYPPSSSVKSPSSEHPPSTQHPPPTDDGKELAAGGALGALHRTLGGPSEPIEIAFGEGSARRAMPMPRGMNIPDGKSQEPMQRLLFTVPSLESQANQSHRQPSMLLREKAKQEQEAKMITEATGAKRKKDTAPSSPAKKKRKQA
ncbi:hypothetical protein EUX98_g9234 [Antrodiella citrinella]|uniref:Uncharacterized protein n=1 Tax=Antrodiella citrinella TaxID=2447956 RepID=A0A4S4LY70_9APHY|nr:hypothetical protein EUX98_g9234 [Antrodiella citrinella]